MKNEICSEEREVWKVDVVGYANGKKIVNWKLTFPNDGCGNHEERFKNSINTLKTIAQDLENELNDIEIMD